MASPNGHQQQQAPSPVSVSVAVQAIVADDGTPIRVLTLNTPTGSHVTFWTPEALGGLGRTLIEAASGLHIPGGN